LDIRLSAAPVGAHYGAHANVVLAEKFCRWKLSQSGLINFLWKTNEKYLAIEPRTTLRCKNKKFDTKTKFKKHTNGSIRCGNFRSID
jgi:hypothetical protein